MFIRKIDNVEKDKTAGHLLEPHDLPSLTQDPAGPEKKYENVCTSNHKLHNQFTCYLHCMLLSCGLWTPTNLGPTRTTYTPGPPTRSELHILLKPQPPLQLSPLQLLLLRPSRYPPQWQTWHGQSSGEASSISPLQVPGESKDKPPSSLLPKLAMRRLEIKSCPSFYLLAGQVKPTPECNASGPNIRGDTCNTPRNHWDDLSGFRLW